MTIVSVNISVSGQYMYHIHLTVNIGMSGQYHIIFTTSAVHNCIIFTDSDKLQTLKTHLLIRHLDSTTFSSFTNIKMFVYQQKNSKEVVFTTAMVI